MPTSELRHLPRTRHRLRLAVTATVTAVAAALIAPVAATAAAPTSTSPASSTPLSAAAADDDFYSTPSSLPTGNGDLVRSEPSSFYLDPLKVLQAQASVHRIMYRTTDRTDTPIAVTGTVLTPKTPWHGSGQRPLIGYAVGTQGLGDNCAPSKQLAAGSEYEGLFIKGLLARGWAVVVTDYQGLGTEGHHTYMSREVQGRAVLDSIRAAQRLPEADLPDAGPVGITGYSQGGGAAASAAELAPTYAPELDLKGTVAGAVPADLDIVADNLDGSLYFGFLGYALVGLSTSYDLDISPYLNQRGRDEMATIADQCVVETVADFAFVRSSRLTADGRSIPELIEQAPFDQLISEQLIGDERAPQAPTLVTHSVLDDVIPYRAGKQLAQRWCGQGAPVRLSTNLAPTHVGGAIRSYPEAFVFLEARFSGQRFTGNC